MEHDRLNLPGSVPSIQVRMLGRMTISRNGATLALPASRKVRALFAYLALAPAPILRSRLCELLWDVPNDPRGELRWCLSKIRRIVDDHDRQRVCTRGDTVQLDLTDCSVDAVEIARATAQGIDTVTSDRLRALSMLFNGDFLEGLEIQRSPAFNGWLTAQRRRFRACHAALLEHLTGSVPDDEAFGYLDKWLQLCRSISVPTGRCSPRSRATAGSAKARSISRRPRGCTRPKASTALRFAPLGDQPGQ